jgi:hypothetical protein
MAVDSYSKNLLIKEWDKVTKPLAAKLDEMHADVKIGCVDKAYQLACEAKEAKEKMKKEEYLA